MGPWALVHPLPSISIRCSFDIFLVRPCSTSKDHQTTSHVTRAPWWNFGTLGILRVEAFQQTEVQHTLESVHICWILDASPVFTGFNTGDAVTGMKEAHSWRSNQRGTAVNLKKGQWAGESGDVSEQSELLPVPPGPIQKMLVPQPSFPSWKKGLGLLPHRVEKIECNSVLMLAQKITHRNDKGGGDHHPTVYLLAHEDCFFSAYSVPWVSQWKILL
ncbi:uncharacterized protein [Equus asinus]|uniref:uncharacterized protein n=1 Tax=Equus asinus TaxID=9793 RepID=UPI0038F788FD